MKKSSKIILILIIIVLICGLGWLLVNNQNKNNNNGTQIEETNNGNNEANEAIKTALNNKEWCKENLFKNINEYSSDYEYEKTNFAKIKTGEAIYIISYESVSGREIAYLITCEDNQVAANWIATPDYATISVDVEKGIILGESDNSIKYFEIKDNGDLEEIASGTMDGDQTECYYNGEKCTYAQLKEYFSEYNFSKIDIKLTSENIDEYVK